MAHIRKQFKEQSSKKLDGYNRKKYVCKILYMYLLGYDLEFGYMEAVRLVSSTKFSEKQIVRFFAALPVRCLSAYLIWLIA